MSPPSRSWRPTTVTPSRWRFRPPSPRTFRLSLSASAYSPQRRLRPNRAPYSVQERPNENAVAHASSNHSDRTGDVLRIWKPQRRERACPIVTGCLALARRRGALQAAEGRWRLTPGYPRLRPKRTQQRAQPAADRGRRGLRAASARPQSHAARVALRPRTRQTPAIERREPVRCWPLQQTTRSLGRGGRSLVSCFRLPARFRLARTGTQPPHRARTFESQAFIESWLGKLKVREVWLNERDTLDDAKRGIGGYVDRYHHHVPSGSTTERHSRSGKPGRSYRKPWPEMPTPAGSTSISTMRRCHECCCL
jgi:hypothetical protein